MKKKFFEEKNNFAVTESPKRKKNKICLQNKINIETNPSVIPMLSDFVTERVNFDQ